MRIYVMRHGPAEDVAPTGRDRDRALSTEGRATVERTASALRRVRGEPLPRVVSSPLVRARQTAELMAARVGVPSLEIEHDEGLAPDEPPPMGLVVSLLEAGTDTLLVGHHPQVIVLLRSLVRDAGELPLGLHTGMLVGLTRSDEAVRDLFQVSVVLDPHRMS
jgi:phosphohistidine phosphatase